jgi:hypothetical protein
MIFVSIRLSSSCRADLVLVGLREQQALYANPVFADAPGESAG